MFLLRLIYLFSSFLPHFKIFFFVFLGWPAERFVYYRGGKCEYCEGTGDCVQKSVASWFARVERANQKDPQTYPAQATWGVSIPLRKQFYENMLSNVLNVV